VAGESVVQVGTIVHGYRSIVRRAEQAYEDANRGPFGNSGNCNINVNCPEGDPWQVEKRGVALIVNGSFAVCSGTLVNNTAQDGTPYFLTANHCLGGENNWIFYFNHETAGCTGSTGPVDQSISGSTLRASNGGSDVALLELSATPPTNFNVQYCGWDNSDDLTVTETTSIHHPSGDLKKICFDNDPPYHAAQGGAAV
jgi:lysyl endopeptidase